MSRTSEAPLALAEGAAARSAVTTTAKAIANLALRRMRPGEANRSSWAGEKTHRRGARRCGGRERNLNGITPSPCFPLDTAHATPVGAERNPLRPLHQPQVHRVAGTRRRASVSPSRESRSGTELRDTPGTHFRLVPPATHSERGFPRGAYRNRTGVNGFAGRCVTTPPRRRAGQA